MIFFLFRKNLRILFFKNRMYLSDALSERSQIKKVFYFYVFEQLEFAELTTRCSQLPIISSPTLYIHKHSPIFLRVFFQDVPCTWSTNRSQSAITWISRNSFTSQLWNSHFAICEIETKKLVLRNKNKINCENLAYVDFCLCPCVRWVLLV